MTSIREWLSGATDDGQSLPLTTVNAYRARRQLPPIIELVKGVAVERKTAGTVTVVAFHPPASGLGDTVESVLKRCGLHQWITAKLKKRGKSCACRTRKDWLNHACPYSRAVWRTRLLRFFAIPS